MQSKYEIIADLWNKGLSEGEIGDKLNIKINTVKFYLREAKVKGIELREFSEKKERVKSFVLIAEDWNNGLEEEKILEKYNIKKITLQTYLSKAKKNGIGVKSKVKEKAKPKYMQVVDDWNNGLPEEKILEKYNIKKNTLQTYLNKAKKNGIEVKLLMSISRCTIYQI